jgi:hypothetical protein
VLGGGSGEEIGVVLYSMIITMYNNSLIAYFTVVKKKVMLRQLN